ncbi:hypothetical protein TRAPUB_6502, partial [Trametes pubescens]
MNLGAILVGCIIQAMFYGNMFSLAWRYYTVGRGGDPWWYNVSIGAAWSVNFYLLINSIVATLVRLLYVYRLGKLCQTPVISRGRPLVMILLGLSVMLCVVEMAASATISSRLYVTDTAMTGREGTYLRPIFYLLFATGWSADLILTGIMCIWLHSARTGFHRTDSAINNMIVYTLETGIYIMILHAIALYLTLYQGSFQGVFARHPSLGHNSASSAAESSLIETIGMVTFIIAPETQIFIAFYIQIGLLYLSSLLIS